MATLGTGYLTILDWAKRKDPSGTGVAPIVEALQKRNDILQDLPVAEGNLDGGEQITSRTLLPTPTARRINQGITKAKSGTDQVVEPAALFENESCIDVEHPGIKRGGASFRASEDKAFSQGFMNEMATGLFYYNQKAAGSSEKFHGLTARLDATSGNPASGQIIKVTGNTISGSTQASVWLIGFGPDTVYSFFPAGSTGGFEMEDMGRQRVLDRNSNPFWAWTTRFVWRIGLAVKDYRYIARVCNIDVDSTPSGLGSSTANDALSIALGMEDALAAIFAPESVSLRFYMNRTVFSLLNKQLMAKSANLLEWIDMGGRRIPSFLGVPIRICDALTNAESIVS